MSDQPAAVPTETLPFVVLDVFTDRPFAGNPLAVVLDGEELSGGQMQQIAREFNLSETAFPLRPTELEVRSGADYVLRIFTPEVELPFAGHPSVGTAWWLAKTGRIGSGLVHQLCGEGLLPLEVSDRGATLTGGTPRVGEPVSPTAALAAVGLGADALTDRQVRVSTTGLPYAVLFVRPEQVTRCRPNMQVLKDEFSHPQEATGVLVVAWDASARHAHARMFAGDLGSPEDPATGSAALALAARLVAEGEFPDGQTTFTVDQGIEMGRPSRLTVICDVVAGKADRLQVSGGAVLVSEGTVRVPKP
ncbi:MAG: PhzF family phenazine biosynthesis protein [Actinomycetes bacterium]